MPVCMPVRQHPAQWLDYVPLAQRPLPEIPMSLFRHSARPTLAAAATALLSSVPAAAQTVLRLSSCRPSR